MNTKAIALGQPDQAISIIQYRYFWWVAATLLVLLFAIRLHNFWFLNFVHVFAGLLWTGVDLFMGFVIGPILRRLNPDTRLTFVTRLMPRMLFLMPTVSMVTTTAGWYLASWMGFFSLSFPKFGWVLAALVIVTVLTVQGLGILLPVNLRVLFEARRAAPDTARIARWMRIYVRTVASQGVMQVGMIVIMTRFATGL
ncbi:MAG: hypothetical protein ACE5JS_20440 [Nitrospinota bacterium]